MANIAGLLKARLATPERILYRQFLEGGWREISAREIAAYAARWQAFLRAEGLAPGDRVALCLKNGIHWVAADQGALGLGLVVVPLYADDNPENVAWCLENSGARLLVAESSRMAHALQGVGRSLPRVLCLSADPGSGHDVVEAALPRQAPAFEVAPLEDDALATICYTSGTVGRPKGVMLTHGNILANVAACERLRLARSDDVFLSLLPLSHMFERTGGYYLPLSIGAKVAYARSVSQLAEDLASERPTVMFAVPRVFEKFAARLNEALAKSPAKKRLFDLVVAAGRRGAPRRGHTRGGSAFGPARAAAARRGRWRAGGGTRVWGGEGWLHTGDLAEIRDSRIFIRGRLKDVLVLSNGEKLPPQDVELAILGDGAFEQGVLIGEGRPFLTLVAVTQETDEKRLIQRANERLKGFPGYIRVRRVVTTREPWTIENGLLTPTLKVKRERVQEKFRTEIERAYAAGALD